MRAIIFTLLVALAAVTGARAGSLRISGGSTTTINNYPSMVAILSTEDLVTFRHNCGGTIINNRAILSAAHCFGNDILRRNRFRVGSTFANSGGVVHTVNRAIIHPRYSFPTNDLAILRTGTAIRYNNSVRPGSFAGANVNVPDNANVWATGWGWTGANSGLSEQLRHVQLRIISQAACRQQYGSQMISNDMICAGSRQSGAAQCRGDSGGPLYLNNVIVGVLSFGAQRCGGNEPRVSMRVSRYIQWIQANA
ncbi:trypsin, alkaline B-like [Anticarsia gemmatalis]|uniref:trypsin, alkaline B-like n=1 Tax=Anticarsia gemmatalis TaxID=129554 RepID=UPI003F75B6F3